MGMNGWMVRSWPEVTWKAPTELSKFPAFVHMGTGVQAGDEPDRLSMGDTVWGIKLKSDAVLAVAWEWTEVQPGVFVIADPNGMVTNALLLGDDGELVDELSAVITCNLVAYGTSWQRQVMSTLQERRAVRSADEAATFFPMPNATQVRAGFAGTAVARA